MIGQINKKREKYNCINYAYVTSKMFTRVLYVKYGRREEWKLKERKVMVYIAL